MNAALRHRGISARPATDCLRALSFEIDEPA